VTESGERDAGFIEEKAATDTENCCALCEEQQWTRIAGSVRANDIPACAYFPFNANNNKCRLFSSAARTAALTPVAGVTGGYPMQCADEDLGGTVYSHSGGAICGPGGTVHRLSRLAH
jgi:hypothetical protein